MKTCEINAVEEQLKTDGTAAFLTRGASMYPLLRTHKDIVVIGPAEHPLCEGQVPLYRVDGAKNLVLHRIIGVADDGKYIIRGDNTYQKEYVPQDHVIGVMTAVYRGGKYIDCANSKKYKFYVKFNRFSYPVRWLWKTKIRAFLGTVKRKITGGKNHA